MNLARTTLRLPTDLKKTAQQQALEMNVSLQTLFTQALREYLEKTHQQRAQKLVFPEHGVGVAFDNLTREDYYDDPPGDK